MHTVNNLFRPTLKMYFLLLLSLVWGIVTYISSYYYSQSKIHLYIFSAIFLMMWLLAWLRNQSYFYIFFSTFLVLGFWFKAILFGIFGIGLIEPIGLFKFFPSHWDKVFDISSMAAISVLVSNLIYRFFRTRFTKRVDEKINQYEIKVPDWYCKSPKLVWTFSLIFLVLTCMINYHWSMYQIGIIPKESTFFLHINVLVSWGLISGFALWFACLLWWDFGLNKNLLTSFFIQAMASIFISNSVLSRGFYIYQAGHYFLPFFKDKFYRFPLRFLTMFIIFFFGLSLNLFVVTYFRNIMYQNSQTNTEISNRISILDLIHDIKMKNTGGKNTAINEPEKLDISSQKTLLILLATGRWVGLEGVMSVSSWPNLGAPLFFQAWLEKPSYKKVPLYLTICNARQYLDSDQHSHKNYFASLPGIVAMLDYSGSYWVIFTGIFVLSVAIFFTEDQIRKHLRNNYVLSYYSLYLTVLISMLNNIHLFLIQWLEMLITISFFYFLQSGYFVKATNLTTPAINKI